MPTLKETKGRIGSVRSTLKITSAMKLVASAKLRKAQMAIEAMRPYEREMQGILAALGIPGGAGNDGRGTGNDTVMPDTDRASSRPRAIVAVSSNSALCGSFNASVIAKVRSVRLPGDIVYSLGRKMADAMRRDGFPSPEDYSAMSERPAYGPASELVEHLIQEQEKGRICGVLLVYNHFISTAHQEPVVEWLLPPRIPGGAGNDGEGTGNDDVMPDPDRASAGNDLPDDSPVMPDTDRASLDTDTIFEPGRKELLTVLVPKTVKLKLYAALLDSAASEHSARTVAMQTATDNAENLLDELTLQYNKGRQQKITAEILDLAGGQSEI